MISSINRFLQNSYVIICRRKFYWKSFNEVSESITTTKPAAVKTSFFSVLILSSLSVVFDSTEHANEAKLLVVNKMQRFGRSLSSLCVFIRVCPLYMILENTVFSLLWR